MKEGVKVLVFRVEQAQHLILMRRTRTVTLSWAKEGVKTCLATCKIWEVASLSLAVEIARKLMVKRKMIILPFLLEAERRRRGTGKKKIQVFPFRLVVEPALGIRMEMLDFPCFSLSMLLD